MDMAWPNLECQLATFCQHNKIPATAPDRLSKPDCIGYGVDKSCACEENVRASAMEKLQKLAGLRPLLGSTTEAGSPSALLWTQAAPSYLHLGRHPAASPEPPCACTALKSQNHVSYLWK